MNSLHILNIAPVISVHLFSVIVSNCIYYLCKPPKVLHINNSHLLEEKLIISCSRKNSCSHFTADFSSKTQEYLSFCNIKPRNSPACLKNLHRHKSQMKEPEELKHKKKNCFKVVLHAFTHAWEEHIASKLKMCEKNHDEVSHHYS